MPINTQKKWVLAERRDPDLLTHLLKSREIEDVDDFLMPIFPDQLHDPFLMKDMRKSVERLAQALEAGEPIGVFADYDTDGTPGAALFLDGLRQIGARPLVYIPRRTEGYGLSEEGLTKLTEAGAKVVVTIDLGITGKSQAEFARELGVDLIVTDHHVVQPELFPAAALAVINPKQADCNYPFKELCGGGIIWKVLSALLSFLEDKQSSLVHGRRPEAIRRWALDLAAISTICDMVPLVGENRVLATFGLKVLQKTRRPGLLALLRTTGTKPESVSAGTVGFQIGPRINAPTRLAAEHYHADGIPGPAATMALALLVTTSSREAEDLATELDTYNRERQSQLERVLVEAQIRVEREGLAGRKVLVLHQADWPPGIVGLVAGRLMERYGRPTIVLGSEGNLATGSARSVKSFHLVDALTAVGRHLTKFGGHAKAAGLSLEPHAIDAFYEALLAYADQMLTDEQLGPVLEIDAELTGPDLTLQTAKHIASLAPHGIGNPRPLFLIHRAMVISRRTVGSDNRHIKLGLKIADTPEIINAIGFGLAETFAAIDSEATLDLVVQLDQNEWQGRTTLDLHVLDVRLATETN